MSYLQKYVSKKAKDRNVKAFNMITNKNEAKTIQKCISCNCKCKFKKTTCNSKQIWNDETYKKEYRNGRKWKSIIVWILAQVFVRIVGIWQNVADTSVIECGDIFSAMNITSIKMANTVATNVIKNYHSKKVRYKSDCYILHAVLSVIILILIITNIWYHFAKHRSKIKDIFLC